MDHEQKRPLSEEELAAVDKAMAEFGNSSWKQEMVASKKDKTSAVRKPVLQFSPLVRNILIAAVLLIFAAALLILVWAAVDRNPPPLRRLPLCRLLSMS